MSTLRSKSLDKLKKVLEQVGGVYELRIDGLTGPSQTKLESLKGRDRDFMKSTPQLQSAIRRFAKAEIEFAIKRGEVSKIAQLLDGMADGAKAHILLRFGHSGNDVPMRALTAKWMLRKAERGWDPRIGIAKGVLLRNLRRARFYFRKIRKQ